MTIPLVTDRLGIASGATPLEALASAREQLIEASVALRHCPNVKRIGSGVDCRSYRSGSMFETYVEAELATDQTVTWWIDVTWDRTWKIEGRIYRDDDNGQMTLREFPDRIASDPADFAVRLAEIVGEVVTSIKNSDAID